MTEFSEDRVWARHGRRHGAVLIVGAGAVGGFVAEELSPMGISPLHLVDPDLLAVENLVRHPLGAWAVGMPKASTLAKKIHQDFPPCDAIADDTDFLQLSEEEQLRLVRLADVVVAATDSAACQRRVNHICLRAEKPAVYPAVWVDERVRDAEVGEILWVLPGRHTPCYECWVIFRQGEADAQAARGSRVDIQQISLATARVVAALLDRTDRSLAILDERRTAIYVHGLTPVSPGIRRAFPASALYSRNVHVPFPPQPCQECGGQDQPAPSDPTPTADSTIWAPTAGQEAQAEWDEAVDLRRRRLRIFATVLVAAAAVVVVGVFVPIGGYSPNEPTTQNNHTTHPAKPVRIPPKRVRLICDVNQTSSYAHDGSDCVTHNMYSGDAITLKVSGFTKRVVRALCKRGYHDKWSSTAGDDGGGFGMCDELRENILSSDGLIFENFSNPEVLGKDTVTWRLIGLRGQTVLVAKYSFRVLETLTQSLTTPPS